MKLFNETWEKHLEIEMLLEALRQKLAQRRDFNALQVFRICDLDHDGRISVLELHKMLTTRGFDVETREVGAIIERFDKDRDGTINAKEFVYELAPKSPVKMI